MSRRAGEQTPLSKKAYVSMHEWIQMDCIKPGGTAGVILKLQLLSLQIIVWDEGFLFCPDPEMERRNA